MCSRSAPALVVLALLVLGLAVFPATAAPAAGTPGAGSTGPGITGPTSRAVADPGAADGGNSGAARHGTRFATFNASLNRAEPGQLLAELSTPRSEQARQVAEVVQRARPDVLLLNEFDHDPAGAAVDAFRANYLARPQRGAAPIDYPFAYSAEVNTGVPSGHDLNNDGEIGGPDDAFGFGEFPGQYGMVVLSKHPIDRAAVRTFRKFRWQDMPGALLPEGWYSPEERRDLRLSSKSHWDVPIRVGHRTVHFLVSHPTPPSFDGPEDRNGRRNHDEIRFWADYVNPGAGDYLYDDAGRGGGLRPGQRFVIAGDQNSDPLDGDSVPGAAARILRAHRVVDPRPASDGGRQAAESQGGVNDEHRGPARLDTADFPDDAPGNLRVDYVLPSLPLLPVRSGLFWPTADDELARLNGASDHHLVWTDLLVP